MYQFFNIDAIKMRKAKKSNIKSYNEAINLRDFFQKVSYTFLLQILKFNGKNNYLVQTRMNNIACRNTRF